MKGELIFTQTPSGMTRVQKHFPSGRLTTIGLWLPGRLCLPGQRFADGERAIFTDKFCHDIQDLLAHMDKKAGQA